MMLTHFEFVLYTFSMFDAKELTISSSLLIFDKLEITRFLIVYEMSLMKAISSSLFFVIENLNKMMFSFIIGMKIVRRA